MSRSRLLPLAVAAFLLALALPADAAPLQPADRRAHAVASAAVSAARSPGHRRDWKVTVPAAATVVPARYSVVLVADYVQYAPSASVVRVERQAGRATAEMLTDSGVFRGELPVAALDEWLRTTEHLQRATQTWQAGGIGLTGFRSASHVPYRAIEVRSLDPSAPLDLVLAGIQPIHGDMDEASDVARFAHTWSVRALERLVRAHLGESTIVAVDETLQREILARLNSLPRRTGSTDRVVADRDVTEALLHAALLDRWSYRPAIAALRERGFTALARHLDLVTMPEPQRIAALKDMLCGGYHLRRLATPVARDLGRKAEAPLLAALRCELDEYELAALVAEVASLPTSPAVTKALEALAARSTPERVRIAVDQALLRRNHDAAARTRLTALADRPVAPDHDMPDAQRSALEALVAEASTDLSRRPDMLALIHRVLASIPATAHESSSGMDMLASYLGQLGGPADVPALTALLATQHGSIAVTIIHAIARHDLDAAVGHARQQIDRYPQEAEGSSFSWNVASYHALLLRADARSALPELRRALARARRDREILDLERRGQQALVRYLSATSDAQRVRHLLAYVAATGELEDDLAELLRVRHGAARISDAALERAVAANTAAWARIDPPW